MKIKINNNEIENDCCKFIDENNKNLKILNNFYGQLKSIDISVNNELKKYKIYSNKLFPFPLKDNGGILLSSEIKFNDNNKKYFFQRNIPSFLSSNEDVIDYEVNNLSNIIKIKLKIINRNLGKVNYINYKEDKFNIIDYFGGLTQFLPFLNIINGIYKNNKEKKEKDNNIEKEENNIGKKDNNIEKEENNIEKKDNNIEKEENNIEKKKKKRNTYWFC